MLSLRSRAIAVVAAAAFALTTFGMAPANAGGRHRHGDAIAAAAIIGLFGTVAAIAAANARDRHGHYDRHHYRPPYAAYPGDRYYHRGPVYHGPRWDGRHRHQWYR